MSTTDDTTAEITAPGDPGDRTVPAPGDPPTGLDGPFFQEIGRRKRQGRDAKILVTAKDGQTGVGKSSVCDFLAHVCDTTKEGFQPHKITIDPIRFIELYSELEPGSAAVMEEAEQFDNRRSNRHENVEASQKWQQARVREIVALLNLPDPSTIDKRFERLADFWINVEIRGRARIYEKKIHSTKKQIYYQTLQTLNWPNMDRSKTFQAMDDLKTGLLDGDLDSDGLVRESEVESRVEKARRDERKSVRDELLTSIYRETELTAGDIAGCSAIDVQASRVRQIANDQG